MILTLHFLWKLPAVGIKGVEVLCVTLRIHIHDLEYVYCKFNICLAVHH